MHNTIPLQSTNLPLHHLLNFFTSFVHSINIFPHWQSESNYRGLQFSLCQMLTYSFFYQPWDVNYNTWKPFLPETLSKVNCSPVTWNPLHWLLTYKKSHLLEDGIKAISKEHQLLVHKKLLKPNCHLLLRQRQNGKRKNNRAEEKKEKKSMCMWDRKVIQWKHANK